MRCNKAGVFIRYSGLVLFRFSRKSEGIFMHLTPLLRNYCFFGVSLILLTQHPVMLRETAGEKGYKQTDEMSFSTPPSLRATSPIFCVTKHRGGVLNVSDCETEILHKARGTWRERRFKVSLQWRYAHLLRSKRRLSHHCIRIVLVIK